MMGSLATSGALAYARTKSGEARSAAAGRPCTAAGSTLPAALPLRMLWDTALKRASREQLRKDMSSGVSQGSLREAVEDGGRQEGGAVARQGGL